MTHNNTLKVSTPTDREIVITRMFNAPRDIVWEAMTAPSFLKRWLFGPPGWEMTACEDDRRVGGQFRWAWQGPNGEAMAMTGKNIEITPPAPNGKGARLVRTETFEMGCDAQMGEQHCTLVLTETGGPAKSVAGEKTLMTLTVLYPSKEARDAAIASGMEHGMSAGYNRLEDLLQIA